MSTIQKRFHMPEMRLGPCYHQHQSLKYYVIPCQGSLSCVDSVSIYCKGMSMEMSRSLKNYFKVTFFFILKTKNNRKKMIGN